MGLLQLMEKKEGKQITKKGCSCLWTTFSTVHSDLVVFSPYTLTHPLLRLACRNHTCLCSNTTSAKLKLSKSHLSLCLSRATENQTYPYTTQTEAFREMGVWVESLKRGLRGLCVPARIGEGAWQQPAWRWKISSRATLAFFQAFSFDSHSKRSATVTASPHKGDTVAIYQRRRLFDKKKKSFQKYASMNNGPHWKCIQCGERMYGLGACICSSHLTLDMQLWQERWWLWLQLFFWKYKIKVMIFMFHKA